MHTFSFNESARTAFSHGDCYALARALHRRHNYPIALIGTCLADENGLADGMFWVHALNQLPDGRFVDILGIYEDEDTLLAGWDNELQFNMIRERHNNIALVVGQDAIDILSDSEIHRYYPRTNPSYYADRIHTQITMKELTPAHE